MTAKKSEPKALTADEKLAILIAVLKRNGISMPKELDSDEAAD